MIMNCFRCGSPDHFAANCPNRTRPRSAPAAAPASPAAQEEEMTPYRARLLRETYRSPGEKADYEAQAGRARRLMGWAPDQVEAQRREKALAQVAGSRAARGVV